MSSFASAIYTGKVRHRRFTPKPHEFHYQVFMMYLDTRELADIFSLSPFWSLKRFAPAQFKRSDFHINRNLCSAENSHELPGIEESVRRSVLDQAGIRSLINGPIPYSADADFVMGRVPELDNYFVATGFLYGIAAGGGAGQMMAEWMLEGRPSLDLWPLDVRRFAMSPSQPSSQAASSSACASPGSASLTTMGPPGSSTSRSAPSSTVAV